VAFHYKRYEPFLGGFSICRWNHTLLVHLNEDFKDVEASSLYIYRYSLPSNCLFTSVYSFHRNMSRLECGLGLQAKVSSSFGSIKKRARKYSHTISTDTAVASVCLMGSPHCRRTEKPKAWNRRKSCGVAHLMMHAAIYAFFACDNFRWFLHRFSMASGGKGSQRFVDMQADRCHAEGEPDAPVWR
jgi:hypothetical protein